MADPVALLLHVAALTTPRLPVGVLIGLTCPLLTAKRMAIAQVAPLGPAVGPSEPAGAPVRKEDAWEPTVLPTPSPAASALAAKPKLKTRLATVGAATLGTAATKNETMSPVLVVAVVVGQGAPTALHGLVDPTPILPGALAVPVADGPTMVAAARTPSIPSVGPKRPRAEQERAVILLLEAEELPLRAPEVRPGLKDGLRPITVARPLPRLLGVPVTRGATRLEPIPEEGRPTQAKLTIRTSVEPTNAGLTTLVRGPASTVPSGTKAVRTAVVRAAAVATSERVERLAPSIGAVATRVVCGRVAPVLQVLLLTDAVVGPPAPAVVAAKSRRVATGRRAPADTWPAPLARTSLAGLARKDVPKLAGPRLGPVLAEPMATVGAVRPKKRTAPTPIVATAKLGAGGRPAEMRHAWPSSRRAPPAEPVLAPREVTTAIPTETRLEPSIDGDAAVAGGRPVAIGANVAKNVSEEPLIPAVVVDTVAKPPKTVTNPMAVVLDVAAGAATVAAIRPRLEPALPLPFPRFLAIAEVATPRPAVWPAVTERAPVREEDTREALVLPATPATASALAACAKLKARRLAKSEATRRTTAAGHKAVASSPKAIHPATVVHPPAVQPRAFALLVAEGPTLLPPTRPAPLAATGRKGRLTKQERPVIRRIEGTLVRMAPADVPAMAPANGRLGASVPALGLGEPLLLVPVPGGAVALAEEGGPTPAELTIPTSAAAANTGLAA